MHKYKNILTIIGAIIVLVILSIFFKMNRVEPSINQFSTQINSNVAPEIKEILTLKNTQSQAVVLNKLLDRVGPKVAQELMLRSGLPFTGETHLLIHTIGDYIYKKYGKEGLPYCQEYFLSACYHSFIINVLADYHMDGMVKVMDTCSKAGVAVASQCAHASGHGFVAWQDYDLVKAAEMCDELGKNVKNFAYPNCYDGVFMENIWGVHGGKPSEKRWIKESDIYYPCDDSRIPTKYLGGCWANQATLMYQHFRGDLKKTAEGCDGVQNEIYKNTCYNNFARQIHPLTQGNKDKAISLCMNATGKDRQNTCMLTIMGSAWSVGDREMPFSLCSSLENDIQSTCNDQLTGLINFTYGDKPEEKKTFCNKISNQINRDRCLNINVNNRIN